MDTTPMPMPVSAASKVTSINDRCCIRDLERMRTVLTRGLPMFCYDLDDEVSERNAVVTLVNDGWAMQQEIAATVGGALPRCGGGNADTMRWESGVWNGKSGGRRC